MPNKKKFVVVGGGPAGLYLAARLLRLSYDVCVVEKRPVYSRENLIIHLTDSNRADMVELCGDKVPEYMFPIKQIECLLAQTLQSEGAPIGGEASLAGGSVRFYRPYEFISLDKTAHCVNIQSVADGSLVSLPYDYVVDCTGSHQHVLQSISGHGVTQLERPYQPLLPNYGFAFYDKHGMDNAICEKIARTSYFLDFHDSVGLSPNEITRCLVMLKEYDLHDGASMPVRLPGWTKPQLPLCRMAFYGESLDKLGVYFELPESILKESNVELRNLKTEAYSKRLIWVLIQAYEDNLKDPMLYDEFDAMIKLQSLSPKGAATGALCPPKRRVMTSMIHLVKASQFSLSLNEDNTKFLILVGDSCAASWASLGTGLNDAFEMVDGLCANLSSNGIFDAEDHHSSVCSVIDNTDSLVFEGLEQQRLKISGNRHAVFSRLLDSKRDTLQLKGRHGEKIQGLIDELQAEFHCCPDQDEAVYLAVIARLEDVLYSIRFKAVGFSRPPYLQKFEKLMSALKRKVTLNGHKMADSEHKMADSEHKMADSEHKMADNEHDMADHAASAGYQLLRKKELVESLCQRVTKVYESCSGLLPGNNQPLSASVLAIGATK